MSSNENLTEFQIQLRKDTQKREEEQKKFCDFFNNRNDLNEIQQLPQKVGEYPEVKIRGLQRKISEGYQYDMPWNPWSDKYKKKEEELDKYSSNIQEIQNGYKKLREVFDAYTVFVEGKKIDYNKEDHSEYQIKYTSFFYLLKELAEKPFCESKGGKSKGGKSRKKYLKSKKSKRNKNKK